MRFFILMFVTAVCFLFLIKQLRWPKMKRKNQTYCSKNSVQINSSSLYLRKFFAFLRYRIGVVQDGAVWEEWLLPPHPSTKGAIDAG